MCAGRLGLQPEPPGFDLKPPAFVRAHWLAGWLAVGGVGEVAYGLGSGEKKRSGFGRIRERGERVRARKE